MNMRECFDEGLSGIFLALALIWLGCPPVGDLDWINRKEIKKQLRGS